MKRRSFVRIGAMVATLGIPLLARGEPPAHNENPTTSTLSPDNPKDSDALVNQTRRVFISSEETGVFWDSGDRVIELAALEALGDHLSGVHLYYYLNPQGRKIDPGATLVHGIHDDELDGMPLFEYIAEELTDFVSGAEVVVLSRLWMIGVLDNELRLCGRPGLAQYCKSITDLNAVTKMKHAGQNSGTKALCRYYGLEDPDSLVSTNGHRRAWIRAHWVAALYFSMMKRKPNTTAGRSLGDAFLA